MDSDYVWVDDVRDPYTQQVNDIYGDEEFCAKVVQNIEKKGWKLDQPRDSFIQYGVYRPKNFFEKICGYISRKV